MDLGLTNHIYFVMLESSVLSTLKENLHNLFFDIDLSINYIFVA